MAFSLAATQGPQHTWANGNQDADARKYWLRSTQYTPTGPQIGAVVAGMAPGDFEQINATSSTFFRVQRADDGTAAAILDWTPTQVWHAATQQILRGGRRGTFKLTAYSDVTGEEREMPCPFGRLTNGTAHFYGNIAQDGAGYVYYGTTESVSETWRLEPVTETWTKQANTPSYSQLGSSMEWFPEANSGAGGLIKSLDFATSTLRVILQNAAGTSWTTLASGVPNSQHALLRYHANHARVLILGGTNTQTAATFLEADGTATASSTAIPANIHGMSPACWVIAHPSGCWLVRSGADLHVYAAWPNETYDDITWVDLGAAPDAALSNPTAAWEPTREVVLITAETGTFAWMPPTLDAPGETTLTVQDATHGHTADNITLSTGTTLTVQDAVHGHAADNLDLDATNATNLTVQDATHGHAADAVALTTDTTLAVQDALHAHAADNLTLEALSGTTLTVQDSTHAHAAESPTLTLASISLTVQDALHGHAADEVELGLGYVNLVVQDARHGHTADSVTLSGDVEPPAPPAPTLSGGGGGDTSRRRRRSREDLERDEEEAFEDVMRHLKRPQREQKDLQEVLEIVMALAAAGVLD